MSTTSTETTEDFRVWAGAHLKRDALLNELVRAQIDFEAADARVDLLDEGNRPIHPAEYEAAADRACELAKKRDELIAALVVVEQEYQAAGGTR